MIAYSIRLGSATTEPCTVYLSGATTVDMGMVLAGGSGGRNSRVPVSRFQVVSGTGLQYLPVLCTHES